MSREYASNFAVQFGPQGLLQHTLCPLFKEILAESEIGLLFLEEIPSKIAKYPGLCRSSRVHVHSRVSGHDCDKNMYTVVKRLQCHVVVEVLYTNR